MSNQLYWFPGYLFLPILTLFAIISASSQRQLFTRFFCARAARWTLFVCAGISFILMLALSLNHVFGAGYGEQNGESFATKALLICLGKPLFTDVLQSAERYSLMHGPTAFLVFGAAMSLFGRSLFVCKFVALVVNLLSGLFTYLAFRRVMPKAIALPLASLTIFPFILIGGTAFITIRTDGFILLPVAWGLWGVIAGKPSRQLLIISLAAALVIGVKINTFICVAPLLALINRFPRPKDWIVAAVAGIMIVLAPFAFPQVSLWHYLGWVRLFTKVDAGIKEFPGAVHWFILLVAPIMLALWVMSGSGNRGWKYLFGVTGRFAIATAVCLFAMTLPATRAGASPNYLIPFMPVLVYAYILLARDIMEAVTVRSPAKVKGSKRPASQITVKPAGEWLLVFATAMAATWQILQVICTIGFFQEFRMEARGSEIVYADVDKIMTAFPGKTISIGFGNTQSFFIQNHRFKLVSAGHPYFLDGVAIMNLNKADVPLPDLTVQIIARKMVDIWLIPRGEEPFSIRNYYPPNNLLFDMRFRESFQDNYHLIGNSSFFDIYEAKP
jgi:hypothetical protein